MDAVDEKRLAALEQEVAKLKRHVETLVRNLAKKAKFSHRERQVLNRQLAAQARGAKKTRKKRQ